MLALGSFVVLGLPDGILGTAWPSMRVTLGAPVGDLGLILLLTTAGSVLVTAFVGTLIESLVLAAIGGALGALATYAAFNGFTTSTMGASFTQVVFHFQLSPNLIGQGVTLALIVGLAGGLLPAIRAARMPIVAGLQG